MDKGVPIIRPAGGDGEAGTIVAAPLVVQRGPTGALVIETPTRVEPTDDDLELLALFSSQAAIAVRNTHELERLRSGALAALGRMATQVAHEIKNPLAGLRLYARHLDQRLGRAGDTEGRELAGKIAAGVEHLADVVAEITAFGRPPELHRAPTNVHTILDECLELAAARFATPAIEVVRGWDPACPEALLLDPRELRKAFLNLIVNAFEALDGSGRLTLTTSYAADSGMIAVMIEDTGVGMSDETISRAFDLFYTTKPDGTGLGMSIARSVVQLHGGELSLQSRLGPGTRGSVRKAMEATKGAGAFHVLEKPFDPDELLGLVRSALDHRRLVVENTNLRRRLADRAADSEILGQAPGIQRVLETVAAVADADANVLIIGESGTGKELVADALHERSRRRGGPWVKINCAALPKDLIESELFGHTRGAFTGATSDKTGLLEEADGGSLLLDEITEMPAELQAKLLRVLEERAVRRVGAAKAVPVDFRLISSTNRSPEAALREGRLRQDLFFRINTVSIDVPPLRERREDIPILVRAFLERYRAKHGRDVEGIEPEAYRRLLAYAWPGNVRELQNALERAVLVTRGPQIALDDLPEPLQRADAEPGAAAAVAPSEVPVGSLEEIERVSILRALEMTKWNKQAAAPALGLRRPTLYSKMRKHGTPQRRP